MKVQIFKIFCLIILSSGNLLFGQSNAQVNVIPPTPNASSLGKFGDVPVSLTTGVPNINIPIYNISEGNINIPIGLSYHAGGVKVEEIASWVGLGWTLNGGGAISRTIRGRADDGYMGLLEAPEIPLYGTTYPLYGAYDIFSYDNNHIDGQPDLYYLNVPGYSAKFVMDKRKNIVVIPDQPIKIEFEWAGGIQFNNYGFTKWKVQTPDNITYYFESMESMEHKPYQEWAVSETSTSTWYLTKIVDNTSKKEVTFNYETYTQGNYTIPGSWSKIDGMDMVNVPTYVVLATNKRLQSIVFSQGSITFVPTTQQRSDWVGDKALDHIVVKDNQNNIIKKVSFDYSYFNETGSQPFASTVPTSTSQTKLRLRLDKITESDGVKSLPSHIFEYNNTVFLPDRNSYSYDHWGYYNGKDNPHPLPAMSVLLPNNVIKSYTGANRETDVNFTQAGALNKITYPTGGNTIFEYESHDTKSYGARKIVEDKTLNISQFAPIQANTFSQNLVLTSNFNFVKITPKVVYFPNGMGGGDPNGKVLVEIKDLSGNTKFTTIYKHGDNNAQFQTITLPAGNYVVYHTCYYYSDETNYTINVLYQEETLTNIHKNNVGGLRIKKMTDNTETAKAKVTTYNYEEVDANYSSGVLITIPDYAFYPNYTFASTVTRTSVSQISLGFTQGSHINYGRVTVYTTNADGTETNGKTVYEYTTAKEYPDVYNSEFNYLTFQIASVNPSANLKYPYPPADSRDWLRGLLKKQTIFKKDGNVWKVVSETSNTYTVISPDERKSTYADIYKKQVIGIKSGTQGGLNYYYTRFSVSSGLAPLTRTTNKVYDDNGGVLESEVLYNYPFSLTETPDYFNVKQIERQNAGVNKTITVLEYPQDILKQNGGTCVYPTSLDLAYFKDIYDARKLYQNQYNTLLVYAPVSSQGYPEPSAAACHDLYLSYRNTLVSHGNVYNTNKANYQNCLDNLLNTTYTNNPHMKALALLEKQGRITTPIETKQYVEKNGQTYLLGASKSNFFIQNNDQILPNEGHETEFEGMITKEQFEANSSTYFKKKAEYLAFNSKGSILAFRGVNAPTTLYMFGYQNTYPIAKAMVSPLYVPNVLNDRIVDIFHTSFEEETTGVGNVKAKTGKKYKTGSYTLVIGTTENPLLGNRYTLTYWRRENSSNAWTLVTDSVNQNQIVNGVYTKTITGEIDELRFFPSEALMTTYTYDPLVGMTSQTDTNNQTIYYEYDSFGRLKLVRDEKGIILKQHVYHYKGQQE